MATDEIKQTIVIEASLQKIQQDLKQLEGNFKSSFANISSAASSALGAIGVSLSAGAIIGFVKTSVTEIGKLQDAFERTGISADILLKLRPILENTGSSVEEFANSVNAMQKLLVDGSADTIEAFRKVGIEANEILKLAEDPEALLDRIAKGLANVATQTERVAIARQLASRAGARIAPALLQFANEGGIAGQRKKESIITKEDIAAIDEFGDKFNEMFIKAEAVAAKSFIQVIQGIKDVIAYAQEHPIKFIFNFDGGALSIAGTARKIREEAAKAAQGARLGGAASLVEGSAPGLKETNQQRDFKKALDDQIESLRSQAIGLTSSKEAAIANAAEIIKNKAATIGLTESSEELTKRLNEFKSVSLQIAQGQFADQLTKANQGIKVQIVTMTQGKAAGEALALEYTKLDSKLRDIGPAAEEAAKQQKELNDELARAVVPETLKELDDSKIAAQKKQVTLGITFNADEEVRDAIRRAIDKLASEKDPRAAKLAFEAALTLKPELDKATLKSIKTELGISLGLDREFGQVLNQTFTNTLDVAGEKVRALENALQQARQRGVDPMSEGVQKLARDLDQAKFDQAASDLTRDLKIATNESIVLGRTFNLGAANVGAIESQLTRLINNGLDPANERVQQLTISLREAKVGSIFSDLQKGLEDIQNEAEVLGGAIDLPAEAVDRLTDAIKRLIAEGIDPLDPKLQDLKAQLEDAKAAERLADAFQDIARSFTDALNDLAEGKSIKDVAKRLAGNISRALTDALVTKPLEEWIRKQTNDLFKDVFKIPSIPGATSTQSAGTLTPVPQGQIFSTFPAPTGAATQVATTETAIQALSTEATTAIQTIAAESTTAIELSSSTAETAITTVGTTAEAGIHAVEAAAIAAIQAASGQASISTGKLPGGGTTSGGGLPTQTPPFFPPSTTTSGGEVPNIQELSGPPIIFSPEERERLEAASKEKIEALMRQRFPNFSLPPQSGGFPTQTPPFFPSGTGSGSVAPGSAETLIETISTEATSAIESGSITAQTAIESLSVEATTSIEAGVALAETTITTLGTTIEASISALQTAAITGIEGAAAAASGGGGSSSPLSSIPIIGQFASMFSGGGGAAGGGGFTDFTAVGSDSIFSSFPVGAHGGGLISSSMVSRRFHEGGAISPAIDSVQLSKAAQSVAPRFHDGGQMWNGDKMGGGDLKPGERVIIAEDGEFVLKKQIAMKIGSEKLEKLNRGEAMIIPKRFHEGGRVQHSERTVINHISALAAPRLHDGGTISAMNALDRWPASSADLSYISQAANIPTNAMLNPTKRDSKTGPMGKFEMHLHGVQDADSFRRNQATIFSAAARAMKKGMKYE